MTVSIQTALRQLAKSIYDLADSIALDVTEEKVDESVLGKNIYDLGIGVRARRCLSRLDINTVRDLLKTSESFLLKQKNFGRTSLSQVRVALDRYGLRLKTGCE